MRQAGTVAYTLSTVARASRRAQYLYFFGPLRYNKRAPGTIEKSNRGSRKMGAAGEANLSRNHPAWMKHHRLARLSDSLSSHLIDSFAGAFPSWKIEFKLRFNRI
jgi:hypothetical protein